MSEQNLLLLTHADPRRDSYGFAVRPQHLQRYREYGSIYKEEEEERSDKWTSFLQRCSESIQACKPAEEHLKPLEANATNELSEAVSVNHIEENGSSGESSTYTSCKEGGVEKGVPSIKGTKHHNVQTWAPLRPSVAPIETMLCVRVKNKVCKTKCHVHQVQEHLPPIVEEMFASENLEELENNSERKCSSEGSAFTTDVSDVQGEETEVPATPASICHYDATSNQTYQENKTSVDENTDDNGVVEKTVENTDDNLVTDKTVEFTEDSVVTDKTVENTDDNVVTDKTVENSDDNVVDTESLFPQKEELESLVHGGVPKSLRGEVWQAFVGVRARRVEGYYQKLLNVGDDSSDSKHFSSVGSNGSSVCAPEKWRKQIEKDLPRTFPGHPALDEEGRNSLRRILTAYARHNPSVGYCQAMNFFAGLLLLLMPEENAFWMLVGIIDDYFEGYYTHEMIESQVDQLVFEELMRERFPKLVHHLDYLGMEVAWVSGPWFLSIFMNMLPWESVLRVWDVILYEGNRVMLFRTALALMELYGPALVTTHDAADAISLLQSLTGSTFDSSQLVFTACMGFLGVTEARLEELREKHRPSVLGIIEERTKGSEVSKESKSLASKLYSFKQDAQSLIKEPDTNDGLSEKFIDSVTAEANSSPANFDEFMCALSSDTEISSSQDQQEQVVWLKVELCRLMEEKRLATLRAEELETAFLEIVKQDNRRELSARVEELEQEVSLLRQALADKQEQEHAMLQVLMRVEQEQKVTEDARIAAEQEVAAQKRTVHVLQEKYDNAVGSLAEMDKRVVMAESMLQATLQYESGQAKVHSSPRSTRADSPRGRRTGLLSFGLGWRDKNKDQGES